MVCQLGPLIWQVGGRQSVVCLFCSHAGIRLHWDWKSLYKDFIRPSRDISRAMQENSRSSPCRRPHILRKPPVGHSHGQLQSYI